MNFAAELKKITDKELARHYRNVKPKKKFAEKLNDMIKMPYVSGYQGARSYQAGRHEGGSQFTKVWNKIMDMPEEKISLIFELAGFGNLPPNIGARTEIERTPSATRRLQNAVRDYEMGMRGHRMYSHGQYYGTQNHGFSQRSENVIDANGRKLYPHRANDISERSDSSFYSKMQNILKGPMSVADVIRSYNGMSMNAKMNMDRDLGTNFIQYLNAEGNLGWTDYKREMRKFYAGGNMVRRWMKKYGVDDASGPLAFGTVVSRKRKDQVEPIDWHRTFEAIPYATRKDIVENILIKWYKEDWKNRGKPNGTTWAEFLSVKKPLIEEMLRIDNMNELETHMERALTRFVGWDWHTELLEAVRPFRIEPRPW